MMMEVITCMEREECHHDYKADCNAQLPILTSVYESQLPQSYQDPKTESIKRETNQKAHISPDIDVDFLDAYDDSIYTGKFFNTKQDHRDALLCNLYTQVEFLKTELLEKNFLIRTLVVRENEFERDLRAHARCCRCKSNYESDEGIGTISSSPTESLKKIAGSIHSISSRERDIPFDNVSENPFGSLVSTRVGSLHGSVDSVKSVVENYSTLLSTNNSDHHPCSDDLQTYSTMCSTKESKDNNFSDIDAFVCIGEPFVSIGDVIDCKEDRLNGPISETLNDYRSQPKSLDLKTTEKFDSFSTADALVCEQSTKSELTGVLEQLKGYNSPETASIEDCEDEEDGDDTITTIPSSHIDTESKELLTSFTTTSRENTMTSLDGSLFTTLSNENILEQLDDVLVKPDGKYMEGPLDEMTEEVKDTDCADFLPSMTSETAADTTKESLDNQVIQPADFITVVRKKKEKQHRNHRIKQVDERRKIQPETSIIEHVSYANTLRKAKHVDAEKRKQNKQLQLPLEQQQHQHQQQQQQQQQQHPQQQLTQQQQLQQQVKQQKEVSNTNSEQQNGARTPTKRQTKRLLSIKRKDSQKRNKKDPGAETPNGKSNTSDGVRSGEEKKKGFKLDGQNTYLNIYPERDKFAKGFSYSDIASKGIGNNRGR